MSTFGFDERHVLPALRLLPYDGLVLLAGQESLRSPGFRRIQALEPSLRPVLVDPFDFLECLRASSAVFREEASRGGAVRLSVSGGTKVLADAALLAAFQEGVEAWYFGPEAVRLPVLRGVQFADALAPASRVLAGLLQRGIRTEDLFRLAASAGVPRPGARLALRELKAQGLATETLEDGHAVAAPTAALETYRAHFALRGAGKA